MRVDVYVHGDSDHLWGKGEELGLLGEALRRFSFLAYEEKLTYEVDERGDGTLVAVNGRELA